MFENLDVFRMSSAMARHAGQRQAVVAENVANADTPGYIARDVMDFQSTYVPTETHANLRATRAKHLFGKMGDDTLPAAVEMKDQATPNGNQVSIETEMLKSVGAKRQHDRALAIYKNGISVLRSTLRSS
ncbi:MAG: FlgB family protein [Sulfitobacter sp.]